MTVVERGRCGTTGDYDTTIGARLVDPAAGEGARGACGTGWPAGAPDADPVGDRGRAGRCGRPGRRIGGGGVVGGRVPDAQARRHGDGRDAITSLVARIAERPDVVGAAPEPSVLGVRDVLTEADTARVQIEAAAPGWFALVDVPRASRLTVRRGYANYYPLTSPGIWNLDLSVTKNFSLNEATKLELQGDMVNALNHTQYTTIASNMNGLAFGQATGTASARVIQIQLRLAF